MKNVMLIGPEVLGQARQVDLGSGSQPQPGYVGVDLVAHEGVYGFDLGSGRAWPFADGQLSALYSSHLIEHLPAQVVRAHELVDERGERSKLPGLERFTREQDALFWFMDESWRVCELGAVFELRWPSLVDLRRDPPRWLVGPFMDPTHRRFIPVQTLAYFDRLKRREARLDGYAVSCDWVLDRLLQHEISEDVIENIAFLRKEDRACQP